MAVVRRGSATVHVCDALSKQTASNNAVIIIFVLPAGTGGLFFFSIPYSLTLQPHQQQWTKDAARYQWGWRSGYGEEKPEHQPNRIAA